MKNYFLQKIKGGQSQITLQNLEKLFFALFILSIPLQTRITFFASETYLNKTFNEYATFFLYLSDILLATTLLLFFVNILTLNKNFSIIKQFFPRSPHLIPIAFSIVTLITWSIFTAFRAEYKNVAFYQSIKITEFILLFLYTNYRLQWFGFNKVILLIFITETFQSIIGIMQYYLQRSLGLKILMESVLSPDIPNVAKIIVDGEKIIRAYGTFPHPNVFAGFLILSIFCGIWLLFSHKTPNPYKIVSRETILYGFLVIGTTAQLIAFLLTFSRIAWLTSILLIFILYFFVIKSKLFHVKQFIDFLLKKRVVVLIFIILTPLLIVIVMNWRQIGERTIDYTNKYQQSIDNRAIYNKIAINIINKYPLTGIGGKNYTIEMQKFNDNPLESWQFQPAHNIYLLIASEMGIIGLIIFLWLVYSIIKVVRLNEKGKIVSRETILLKLSFLTIFIGFLFIGLFDHYFWTLQQGQLTFWLLTGLLLSATEK